MSCVRQVEKDFEEWLVGNPEAGVVWVDASEKAHKTTLLLGEDEITIFWPSSYGTKEGTFSIESRARKLQDWIKVVNKRLSKAKSTTKRIGDALTIAISEPITSPKKTSKSTATTTTTTSALEESGFAGNEAGDDEDETAMPLENAEGTDDFDLGSKQFQDGLEVLKMKKKWAAKEAELRGKMKQQQGFDVPGANGTSSSKDKDKSKQIFSSTAALGVLTNDLLLIRNDSKKLGFSAETVEDNIYDWKVRIFGFSEGTQISKEIKQIQSEYGYDFVELRIGFTLDLYPFYPPTVRVVRPRFQGFMMGRVTSMEMLKLSGWDPVKDMRGVLSSIRSLLEEHGKLDVHNPMNDLAQNPGGAYTELEFLLLRLELLCETPARVHAKYPELAPTPLKQQANQTSPSPPNSTTSASPSQQKDHEGRTFWARGTGYGTDRAGQQAHWDVNAYLAAQQQKDSETGSVLRSIAASLNKNGTSGVNFDVLEESCLVPVLESYLRNDSILDMVQHISLYLAVFQVCEALANHEEWLPLFESLPNQAKSVLDLLRTQNTQAKILLTSSGTVSGTSEEQSYPIKLATTIVSTFIALEKNIEKVSASIRELESTRQKSTTSAPNSAAPIVQSPSLSSLSPEQAYESHMKELQYDMGAMDLKTHHYQSYSSGAPATKAKVLRLAQEQASIAISLPLARDSSVFVRVSEERIDYMRALITGPSATDLGITSTPYAGGCFMFDIHFPPTYPQAPPLVNLMTTGHGSVRFNPNLYNCGKVCLSLLGTWSGAEGENWNPKTSTFLQVLVSIQSLIFVPQPFFNEPGYEQQIGTPSGDRQSRQYNEVIRVGTIEHAIIGQLRSPSPGFEEVIKRHFYLMQDRIVAQCNKWADEANSHSSKAHYSKLLKLIHEMQTEFAKLSYPFPKLPI